MDNNMLAGTGSKLTNIVKLAHIRMDFGGIMQSVWNRMGYVALYHIFPLAVFSRF